MFCGSSGRFQLALLFCGLLCLETAPAARALDNQTAASAHPVVIELFTSEGCSSCPPADVILEKLDSFQPIAGAQLIVLSEHVTYWDQLGWKDPNSAQMFTDRQNAYESQLGLKEPYTPQMIVDGTDVVNIDAIAKLEGVLNKAKDEPKVGVRLGAVTIDPSNPAVLRAHVEADVNSAKHNAEVYLAVALDRVESQVLRGENGGKHLVHVAVAQQLTRVGKLPKGKNFAQDVELKLKPGEDPKNLRVIAFVQESGPGKLLGAALWKSGQ